MKPICYRLIFQAFVLLCAAGATAQNTQERVAAFEAEIAAYDEAVQNITRRGQPQKGVKQISALIARVEAAQGGPPERLASYYRLRGQGRMKLQQYDAALTDYRIALERLRAAGQAGREDLTSTWYQLSLAHYYKGEREAAMQAADSCVQAAEAFYGATHSETLSAYSLRANYAAFFNQVSCALADKRQCFDIIRRNVERNFAYLTEAERTAYWKSLQPETATMGTFAHGLRDYESDFSDALFDQQLLSKGLLLSAESALQRAIDSDASLAAEFRAIGRLRKEAADPATSVARATQATLEADRRERALAESAGAFSRFLDFLKVRGSDVRSRLAPGDVAVEFTDYRVGRDSVMYAALVLRPDCEHVRFVPLLEERELAQTDRLGERLWRPVLEAAGPKVRSIYFAPTGRLYLLPVESSRLADGRYLCDAYRVYRLSSTRWLAMQPDTTEGRDAAAYGGLQYDLSVADMEADMKNYPAVASRSAAGTSGDDLRKAGATLPYLPGTLAEAEVLVREAGEAGRRGPKVTLFTGKAGTETSFKALSGQRKRIVHVGTHGFYAAGEAAELERSGLCFAGALNKQRGTALPEGVDDGILTASEAARLDLRGLDLLVLSACQSGMGSVTPDGVFGLQRGFKKAGAGSILMSLWPVDDRATQLLMSRFYAYLLRGSTKREALELAKRDVRSDAAFSDPDYWAAFVLLDGLR